jgi:hypothetical protein
MALSDEEKLEIAVRAFKKKLYSYASWEDFKVFLTTVTREQIKTFIINSVNAEKTQHQTIVDDETANVSELDAFATELETEI